MPLKAKSKQEGQLLWWKNQLGSYALAELTPALIAEYRVNFRKKVLLGD